MTYNCSALLNTIVHLLQVYAHEKDGHVLLNEPSSFSSKHSSSPRRSNGNYCTNWCFGFFMQISLFCVSFNLKFVFMLRYSPRVWNTTPTHHNSLSGAEGQTRFVISLFILLNVSFLINMFLYLSCFLCHQKAFTIYVLHRSLIGRLSLCVLLFLCSRWRFTHQYQRAWKRSGEHG